MDNHTIIATRVRATSLLVGAALLLALPNTVQAQCSQLNTSLSGSDSEGCYYPTQTVEKSESWDLEIGISCSSGGWQTTTGAQGNISGSARGGCGYAENGDPPICEGEIFGPTNGGTSNGEMRVYLSVHDIAYNGSTCYVADSSTVNEYLTDEGCQGGFCCSLQSECIANGEWYADSCTCIFSPLILDLDGNGFEITDAQGGVNFDLDRNGSSERLAWTGPNTKDAFLVLDRNNNGRIDDGGELFGSTCDQPANPSPNGFNALEAFDSDGDKQITPSDAKFESLRLWIDANHDGTSQANELRPLSDFGILAISLDYKRKRRQDEHGNTFRYNAKVTTARGSRVGHLAWDVFLKALP
jgi:hypothetical protein